MDGINVACSSLLVGGRGAAWGVGGSRPALPTAARRWRDGGSRPALREYRKARRIGSAGLSRCALDRVLGDEVAHLRVDLIAPATAAEDAVVARALDDVMLLVGLGNA